MKLEEHLQQLPNHSTEVDLWEKIEKKLSNKPSIADKLPNHKADINLWLGIEKALERKTPRQFLRFRYISAAASVAVIITLSTVFFTHNNQEQLYFSEEIIITETTTGNTVIKGKDIMENCNEYPAVCSSPDFTRLKSNLDQLKREELKLRDLKKATNDPKMELYHSRIVKDIQQVEAQMMQLFS